MPKIKSNNIIDIALSECRQVFWIVLFFSMLTNILMLGLPLYSLNVLNRVLSSGSYETLWMLTLVVSGLFVALAFFNAVRSMVLVKVGEWLDNKLSSNLLALSISSATSRPTASGSQNLRDFNVIKGFFTGSSIITLFDAPWGIIYLIVVFIIHPVVGFITLFGGLILFGLAVLNEHATKSLIEEANEVALKSLSHAEISTRNADSVEAMGMAPAIIKQWKAINLTVQKLQSLASSRASIIMSVTKFIRMFLQILVLGVGAHLVLVHQMTSGAIIACSILTAKALAPFEASMTFWKSVVDTRKSYDRLKKAISEAPVRDKTLQLPRPLGQLTVQNVIFGFANQPGKPILKGINFEVNPGECLAIIGPSASGKSTLAKLLVGVWKANSGNIRLDNADVYTWSREDFGKHVGYLPQDIELFKGKVKENIARMDEDAKDEDIVAAAQASGAHELILHLLKGYETDIGIGGASLSGGQRQRIALARAFYGDPKIIILDEPNASLDEAGELALVRAISAAKARKITTIIISHRQSILSVADKLLVMKEGMVESMGPTKEVLNRYSQQMQNLKGGPTASATGAISSIENPNTTKQA